MSDGKRHDLTPDQERVRKAVRGLPPVAADSVFRERLKSQFVTGKIDAGRAGKGVRPRFGRGALVPRIFIPVAAAVILIIAVILNMGPSMQLADVNGEGTVTVDGRSFDASDRESLARVVRPGARVELSQDVEVDIIYPETAVFQLASATATLPRGPARWFGKTGESRLDIGEIRVLTGSGFQGARLIIETPEGIIDVTGTLVSVARDTSGTCVCVHRGTAQVGVNAGDMEQIPEGKRKVMFADGKPPIVTDIAPPHKAHLVEFETKYRAGLRAPK
jgi:hypothetical protein